MTWVRIPTQKAIFLFQHSVDYPFFFQFHFWFSVQFIFNTFQTWYTGSLSVAFSLKTMRRGLLLFRKYKFLNMVTSEIFSYWNRKIKKRRKKNYNNNVWVLFLFGLIWCGLTPNQFFAIIYTFTNCEILLITNFLKFQLLEYFCLEIIKNYKKL
jgi:hypothetical protein